MVGDRITGPKQEAVVEVIAVSDAVEMVVTHRTGTPDIVILGLRSIAISDWPRVVRRALEMGAGFAPVPNDKVQTAELPTHDKL